MSSTALHSHDGVGRSVTIDFKKEAPTRSTAKAMSFTPSLQTICDELLVEVCFCPGRGGACGVPVKFRAAQIAAHSGSDFKPRSDSRSDSQKKSNLAIRWESGPESDCESDRESDRARNLSRNPDPEI